MRYLYCIINIIAISRPVPDAAEIKDATGRSVTVPDRVERLMASGPTAAVVLYVLAPEKMIGWPSAPRPNEREFILPAARDLPEFGRLTGRGDTANVEVVLQAKPDLIFDFGSVSPTLRVARRSGAGSRPAFRTCCSDGRLDQHCRLAARARRRVRRAASAPRRSRATSRRPTG